jgi:hypothetical protein
VSDKAPHKTKRAAKPAPPAREASSESVQHESDTTFGDEQPHERSSAERATAEPEEQSDKSAQHSESKQKPVVQRTAMRPAGSIEDARKSVSLGALTGLLAVYVGIRCIQWALIRFLTGGSSTLLAATILLPFAAPMLVSSVLINRGRKSFGLAMGGGVIVGVLLAGAYFFLLHHEPAAMQQLTTPRPL